MKAGYPQKMVKEITTKVLNSERDISVKNIKEPESDGKIRVISTFDADKSIMEAVKKSEENLKLTQSFRNQNGPLFKFVKTVGPNIKSQVNSLKKQALCKNQNGAVKCNGKNCKTCKMLLTTKFEEVNGRTVGLASGSCKTCNICYLAKCQICTKCYTGRTIQAMHLRVNGHREIFKEILDRARKNTLQELDSDNDLYTLGLHLYFEHGITEDNGFDRFVKFGLLEEVNPVDIEVKEYKWMHKLNTFQPVGINVEYPFGIPFLGQK